MILSAYSITTKFEDGTTIHLLVMANFMLVSWNAALLEAISKKQCNSTKDPSKLKVKVKYHQNLITCMVHRDTYSYRVTLISSQ